MVDELRHNMAKALSDNLNTIHRVYHTPFSSLSCSLPVDFTLLIVVVHHIGRAALGKGH